MDLLLQLQLTPPPFAICLLASFGVCRDSGRLRVQGFRGYGFRGLRVLGCRVEGLGAPEVSGVLASNPG